MLIKPVVNGLYSGINETTKQRSVASDLRSFTGGGTFLFINRMVTQRVLIRCIQYFNVQ